ncbi:MAG TPA: patatin-like phospholipase family protein [Bryobacteraceae bacterium]|jgi:NTE family protein|nr:patatin-like phospholipase family protein [Bryobacteraceae bacterium]
MRVLFLLVPALACFCQPETPGIDRPKIGVVLEGGGALGLAHIGVLQWFEEHRIPIDYLAGTSMGGLVGGMYATGMPAAELQDLVSTIDWSEALDGKIPYPALSFRRKEDKRSFQNSLEFGLRHGFTGPGGLSSGQRITYLFDRVALPYSDLKSFDDLPIPFRCVATDLNSGREHIFENGPLGEALRATMSLPAIFTPVTNEKSTWVDGGLLNNLPVDVVKKMGADIIVVVHLVPSPFLPESSRSLRSVTQRSISVTIEANQLHSLETADLVVSVDLAGYTGTSYSASAQIIAKGSEGVEKKSQMLSKLALDEAAWQQLLQFRESRRMRSSPTPTFVQISGAEPRLSRGIEKELANHAGKPLDLDRLEKDLDVISGIGRFTRFSYGMTEFQGRPGLEIRAEEKDYAPPLVNLGFLIDGSDLANVRWTTNARITALDVGGFRSEWRTDLSVGSTWGLATEYYRPVSATSKWFVAPRLFATNIPFDLYDHSAQIAQYRLGRYGGGADLGFAIDRFSEIRMGYEAGYFSSSLSIGSPVLPAPNGRTGVSSINYRLDRLDSPLVPRTGQAAQFRAAWIDAAPGAGTGFPLSDAYFGVIRPVSKRGSVYLQTFGGTTFGHNETGLPQFFLGGPSQLSAYGTNELRTDQYWLARVGYVYELFSLPPIIGHKTYFTSAYEFGKAYGAPGASRLPNDGSLGLVMETLAGPLFVGGSVGDTGHRRVYFSLGRFF